MKTIVIANQKGGSGKSTLTVHLAVAAERAGPALLSDTDPQRTASDWFNQRRKGGLEMPRYSPLARANLRDNIDALAAYLFIDTAPSIGSVNADLFAVADLIVIPLNPTPADLRALVKGLPLVKASGRPFTFALTRVRSNLRNNDAAASVVASHSVGIETSPARGCVAQNLGRSTAMTSRWAASESRIGRCACRTITTAAVRPLFM